MTVKYTFAAAGSALLLAWAPAQAHSAAPGQTRAEAEAEVQRLQAQLRNAEQAAALAREAEAAGAEAERANRRAVEAQARLASIPAPTGPLTADARVQAREQLRSEAAAESDRKFGGIEFGVGISYTFDIGSNDRVSSAQLVNGIVRVTDQDNGRARLMLESHYFFKPAGRLFGLRSGMWGVGPFVALQPGEGDIIDAIAGGIMIGFRRKEESTESFNLGVGLVFDPNTRLLGDGLVANQPLPAGETEIRYREEAQAGVLVMASFAF